MKLFKRLALLVVIIALFYGLHYAWISFPIISGYGAKNMCSCVFVSGMEKERVVSEELGRYPLSLARFKVDHGDSSVTATVFGLAKQKAIYRQGLGCTLINDIPESAVRAQSFLLPPPGAGARRDTIEWPLGERIIKDSADGPLAKRLQEILRSAISRRDEKGRQGTRSLMVVYNGRIVGEEYAEGITKDTRLLGWSMAKSITGALVGILVKGGKLRIDQAGLFAEWKKTSDKRHTIQLKHVLQQTTGLDFEENYTKSCEVTRMLFQQGDMGKFVLHRPLIHDPGTVFNYSSGNSNLLSLLLRRTLGENAYQSFPYDSLFYPVGMYQTLLEPDASGTYVGSSYVYATTRDYARFGLLFLNEGKVNGRQILPEGWVKQSTQPFQEDSFHQYGYQIWLNGLDDKRPGQKIYPDGPDDLYYADGVAGQRIIIIPSRKTILVRMGFVKEDVNSLIKQVLECLPE